MSPSVSSMPCRPQSILYHLLNVVCPITSSLSQNIPCYILTPVDFLIPSTPYNILCHLVSPVCHAFPVTPVHPKNILCHMMIPNGHMPSCTLQNALQLHGLLHSTVTILYCSFNLRYTVVNYLHCPLSR